MTIPTPQQLANGNPAIGQIWREVDPRQERFVRIEGEHSFGFFGVRKVVNIDGIWIDAPNSRRAEAKAERFNGKRSGYEFVVDPADAAAATTPDALERVRS